MIGDVVESFDFENNATDRHIFYEVTGKQINEDEFVGSGSSDDERSILRAPDP